MDAVADAFYLRTCRDALLPHDAWLLPALAAPFSLVGFFALADATAYGRFWFERLDLLDSVSGGWFTTGMRAYYTPSTDSGGASCRIFMTLAGMF